MRVDLRITKVWKHEGKPDRIHYMIEGRGIERHLYVDRMMGKYRSNSRPNALFLALEAQLDGMTYQQKMDEVIG